MKTRRGSITGKPNLENVPLNSDNTPKKNWLQIFRDSGEGRGRGEKKTRETVNVAGEKTSASEKTVGEVSNRLNSVLRELEVRDAGRVGGLRATGGEGGELT